MKIEIKRLEEGHQLDLFSSTEPALDVYLQQFALSNQKAGLGVTFVAVLENTTQVIGYYTYTLTSVERIKLPDERAFRWLPHYPLPAFLLARLAVDKSFQGQKLGANLLKHALHHLHNLSKETSGFLILVHAKHEKAKTFYEHYDFKSLVDNDLHLFISMKKLDKALK